MKYKVKFYAVMWLTALLLSAIAPLKVCINLLQFIWFLPKSMWKDTLHALRQIQGDILFRLPQEYREALKLPDTWGLYHNKEYLNSLKLAEVLKWDDEKLLNLADAVCRGIRLRWQVRRNRYSFLLGDDLQDFLGLSHPLYDEMFADIDSNGVALALAKLDEFKFFENYPMPTNATAIGNIAYVKANGADYFEKVVASKILISWRERSAQLT